MSQIEVTFAPEADQYSASLKELAGNIEDLQSKTTSIIVKGKLRAIAEDIRHQAAALKRAERIRFAITKPVCVIRQVVDTEGNLIDTQYEMADPARKTKEAENICAAMVEAMLK